MAENFRRGDRVDWHNSPQMTTDPKDLKRAKTDDGARHEHGTSNDGTEGSTPADHR